MNYWLRFRRSWTMVPAMVKKRVPRVIRILMRADHARPTFDLKRNLWADMRMNMRIDM